jgi:tRNA (guanine-N7-)-methyltransferase
LTISKLERFKEINHFSNVIQPSFDEIFQKNYKLKGKWRDFFGNNNPVIIEVGCGKGEYTVNLGRKYSSKNFIGIDIKGNRMWVGAREALQHEINNIVFLRTRAEFLNSFFDIEEVAEIWLTFPDPQEKKRKARKRLTSARFLNQYRHLLVDNGLVHLKTDNELLFNYTLDLVKHNNLKIVNCIANIHYKQDTPSYLKIKTFYENMFIKAGKAINYLNFKLPKNKEIEEIAK